MKDFVIITTLAAVGPPEGMNVGESLVVNGTVKSLDIRAPGSSYIILHVCMSESSTRLTGGKLETAFILMF